MAHIIVEIKKRNTMSKNSLQNNLWNHRKDYSVDEIDFEHIPQNPYELFDIWYKKAEEQMKGSSETNAMSVSTADKDGNVSSRIVLLKEYSNEGFVFFTNYLSRKAKNISHNNKVALLFFWEIMQQQIRIEGVIEKISIEKSKEYFDSRPAESRASALASPQSEVIQSVKKLKEDRDKILKSNRLDYPDFWGGYIVKPTAIEFWQGRPSRLHNRLKYVKDNGEWRVEILAP